MLRGSDVQQADALAIAGRVLSRAADASVVLPSNGDLRAAVNCLLAAVPEPELAAERTQLKAAFAARTLRIDAAFEASLQALVERLRDQGVVAGGGPARYQPNVVPRGARWGRTAAALFILAYAGYGLFLDDLIIELPTRRRRLLAGHWNMHLHGAVAWTMAAAMLCAVAVLLSVVVDHYDRRDNEAAYQRFAAKGAEIAWVLAIAAVLAHGVTLLLV